MKIFQNLHQKEDSKFLKTIRYIRGELNIDEKVEFLAIVIFEKNLFTKVKQSKERFVIKSKRTLIFIYCRE